ncbi:hypothetical protein DUNSADRAFT_211 [Dunaliella salina]|uniref:Encoded protein n=1 Tax=Dunaliella salina TaxID=3046 RepID=A0ABQ7GYH6_DUNSA|nr:hypothetical protein DUNSADRAFT_211 [Dunaliella salina]|eukprot:KAF5839660.1 hypothetical protein DUNSADRAFT_211 [Dunaliella salina]
MNCNNKSRASVDFCKLGDQVSSAKCIFRFYPFQMLCTQATKVGFTCLLCSFSRRGLENWSLKHSCLTLAEGEWELDGNSN